MLILLTLRVVLGKKCNGYSGCCIRKKELDYSSSQSIENEEHLLHSCTYRMQHVMIIISKGAAANGSRTTAAIKGGGLEFEVRNRLHPLRGGGLFLFEVSQERQNEHSKHEH